MKDEPLERSEARYRTLAEATGQIIWIGRPDSTVLEISDNWTAITGHDKSRAMGRNFLDLIPAEDKDRFRDEWMRALAEGLSFETEFRLRHADGHFLYVRSRVVPVVDADGRVQERIGTLIDLTAEKLAEAAMRTSEERFRRLSEASFEGIGFSENGFIVDCNTRLAELFGYTVEELHGAHASTLVAPESFDEVRRHVESKSDAPYEYLGLRKDGTRFNAEACGKIMAIDGRAVRMSAVRDITDRKRAEAEVKTLEGQLRHSQKLEALGQLAGGIAHDFNNLLTVINGYGERVLEQVGQAVALQEDVDQVLSAGRRAAALTRQLLAFSRRQVLQPRVIDLNTVVTDIQKMLRRVIGENIAMVTSLDANLGMTLADPGQIEQVIMNLAINARDAMPSGGTLTIATRNVEFEGRPYVSLTVQDTGCGMDDETLGHIFEPFFTTKEPGQGTGLGLPTVYGIVTQSGGRLFPESAVGRGTSMRVLLPRDDASSRPEAPSPTLARVSSGTETLLLVEDEVLVRDLMRISLERQGYRVIEAPDAESALGLVEGNRSIDLLVTDVVLPGVDGVELARRLRTLVPLLRVLYVSGYPGTSGPRKLTLKAGEQFLQKPFTPQSLTEKVRLALDGTPRSV